MKSNGYKGSANKVGKNIRMLRFARGLSQRKLAEEMQLKGYNFERTTILKIEKGKRTILDYEVEAFADIFEISLNELYDREKS